jgi:phage antirepressor YoqD-like protein
MAKTIEDLFLEKQYTDMIEKTSSVFELRELAKALLDAWITEKTAKTFLLEGQLSAMASNQMGELRGRS